MKRDTGKMITGFYHLLGHFADDQVIKRFADDPMPTAGTVPAAPPDDGSTAAFLKKAQRVLPLLRFVPGVRGVAVANSVALGTADRHSDIDLLIITAPGRLWTARVGCTVLLHLFGVRRHHHKVAGRFCLSFFITETALDFSRIALSPHDPYLAFWIASLVPVFGRDAFQSLAQANQGFVFAQAGIGIAFASKDFKIPTGESHLRRFCEAVLGARTEALLLRFLLPRTLAKKARLDDASGTIVSAEMLKFHDRDARRFFALNLQ